MGLFFLMLSIMILILYGLQALRNDAVRLVLDPLRRVLKIAHRCKLYFVWSFYSGERSS